MKRTILMVLLAASLFACAAKAPVARINYLGIQAVGYNYHLKFASDQPILDLFAKNKHQRVVLAELVCSLDADQNFDIEHNMKYFARGGFEVAEKAADKDDAKYVFEAIVHFWEGSGNNAGSDQSLAKEELEVLLKGKKEIPCKVRMTVYLSTPYYSETMPVPVKDILSVAKPRQVQ
jgi:hypothetical protein